MDRCTVNYYEHHLGDYMRDTAHLSMVEDGAYRRLIDAYYIAEAPFPDDKREVLKMARATTKTERDAVEYVLRKFFVYESGSGWLHKRCEAEIARFQDKQRKARASAEARWAHSERNANASPNAMRTHSERNANASPNAMRTHSERNANGMHRAPVPSPQSPDTKEEKEKAASAEKPPKPPTPAFVGDANLSALNGKSIAPLSSQWELPEQWGVDAEALGWKPADVLRESERFRQYWTAGKGSGKRRSVKGWRQSWSNWLSKAEGFQR